jgi:chemotaxis protein CheD
MKKKQDDSYKVVKIISGDCYISTHPKEMLVTILGSCIAACIRDPLLKVGGMNHFLLPEGDVNIDQDGAARYGVHAMEQLINGLLKLGAARDRLEVKVFGGSNVTDHSALIGDKNVKFIRDFLRADGFKIASEHLGGSVARRIHYYPDSGKAMVRIVTNTMNHANLIKEEESYKNTLKKSLVVDTGGDVELF